MLSIDCVAMDNVVRVAVNMSMDMVVGMASTSKKFLKMLKISIFFGIN